MGREKKRIDWHWRFQPIEGDENYELTRFLKTKKPLDRTWEYILPALRAFWLPIALSESGQFSSQQVELAALNAVRELHRQADYLRVMILRFDRSDPIVPVGQELKPKSKQDSSVTTPEPPKEETITPEKLRTEEGFGSSSISERSLGLANFL